jgi:hypothetical protein
VDGFAALFGRMGTRLRQVQRGAVQESLTLALGVAVLIVGYLLVR